MLSDNPFIATDRAEREQRLLRLYQETHAYERASDPDLVLRALHPRALDSEIVLVGQGLAESTQRLTGYPYLLQTGQLSPSGGTLDRFLQSFGYTIAPHDESRRYAYHMDVVMRYPGRKESGAGDIPPTPYEVSAAWRWIEEELVILAPRVVIALGIVAARELLKRVADVRVTKKTRLSTLVGRVHAAKIAGRDTPILVTYHPAFAYAHRSAPAAYAWAADTVQQILAASRG